VGVGVCVGVGVGVCVCVCLRVCVCACVCMQSYRPVQPGHRASTKGLPRLHSTLHQ
jgi:hypothetical protein